MASAIASRFRHPPLRRRSLGVQVWKANPPTGLPQPAFMLALGNSGTLQRSLQHRPHCHPRRKVRLLRHISHPRPLAHGYIAGIRIFFACKNLQQRALSRAIWPNQPNAVPIGNSKRDLTKQSSRAKGLR